MKLGSDPPFTHVEQTLLPGTDFYEQLLPFFFFFMFIVGCGLTMVLIPGNMWKYCSGSENQVFCCWTQNGARSMKQRWTMVLRASCEGEKKGTECSKDAGHAS